MDSEAIRLREQKDRLELENVDLRRKLEKSAQRPAEAEARIPDLKRVLFGPKADWLAPERQEQLLKLNQDLDAGAQRPAAACDGALAGVSASGTIFQSC